MASNNITDTVIAASEYKTEVNKEQYKWTLLDEKHK